MAYESMRLQAGTVLICTGCLTGKFRTRTPRAGHGGVRLGSRLAGFLSCTGVHYWSLKNGKVQHALKSSFSLTTRTRPVAGTMGFEPTLAMRKAVAIVAVGMLVTGVSTGYIKVCSTVIHPGKLPVDDAARSTVLQPSPVRGPEPEACVGGVAVTAADRSRRLLACAS